MMSPSGIGLDSTTILSTSIEGTLYGISLVLFGGSMWALTHGRPKDEINWPMALVALTLTILSTIHSMVDIRRLVDGFITKAGILPGGPAGFFADVTQRTFIIKSVAYVLQTLLGDGVVIYRCYVVWQRFGFIMLPVVLWCAALATFVRFLYDLLHATNPEDVSPLDIEKWATLFYLLTLATNVLSSALLAYGIWTSNRNEPRVVRVLSRSGAEDTLLLRVLVDAAVLYTLTLFVLLMFFAYQNTGKLIVQDMITPIISITFNAVPVRLAIAKNDSARATPVVLSPLRFAVRVAPSPSEPTLPNARRSSI